MDWKSGLDKLQVYVIRQDKLQLVPYLEILNNKYVSLYPQQSMEEAHYDLLDHGYQKIEGSDKDRQIGPCPGLVIGGDILIPFIVQEDVESILTLHEATNY